MLTSMIQSPVLTGVRPAAHTLVEQAGVPQDLRGTVVTLDGHNTLAATPSFADELVKIILCDRGADEFRVHLAGAQFTAWLQDAAERRNMANKLVVIDEL